MKPLYVGFGIREKDLTIIVLCVNPDKEIANKEAQERGNRESCNDYKIFNIMEIEWTNEFQWWLVDYDIMELEQEN